MAKKLRCLGLAMCLWVWAGAAPAAGDSQDALGDTSFDPIYRVLTQARCLNCHTATGFPRQGDERRRHDYLVVRGPDNHGAAAMRCTACHGASNNGNFPGAPGWGLAPLSMAWEGLGPVQLCERLKDRRRNGQRGVPQLIDHMSHDPLVNWGWAPGGQRRPIDTPKDEFVRALQGWAAAGAPCG